MYRVSSTDIPGMSRRPFAQRLGDYRLATITIPTTTNRPLAYSTVYGHQPVSGGLGDSSVLGGIGPIGLIAVGVAAWFLFFRGR